MRVRPCGEVAFMRGKQGLLAIFMYVDDLFTVLRTLKEQATRIETVYSPFRLREIDEILGKRPSIVRFITLLGGIVGGISMVGLAVYAHLSFKLITSGKPVFPRVPWVIVCFEGVILLAVIFSVCAWVLKGRLPRARLTPGLRVALLGRSLRGPGLVHRCGEGKGENPPGVVGS